MHSRNLRLSKKEIEDRNYSKFYKEIESNIININGHLAEVSLQFKEYLGIEVESKHFI